PQQWQQQQRRQRFPRHATRQQQPERAQQRERKREPRRFRQPPQRDRPVRQRFEQRPRGIETGRREPPRRPAPARMQRLEPGAGERQRHHHQAPPRDRHQVGQRPGQRSL